MDKIKLKSDFDETADFVLFDGDVLDLIKKIPDNFCKLVVTSPPYNLGKPYESKLHLDEYLEQQKIIIQECVRVLDDSGRPCN